MEERFKKIAEGAALMTDTRFECHKYDNAYAAALYNKPFDDEYYRLAKTMRLSPIVAQRRGRASSDFANVSQLMPCINLFFGITDTDVALHSEEFRDAAGSDAAFEQAMNVSCIMAKMALRYIVDKKFQDEVNSDFQKRKAEFDA
jgi:metal-dependent amidase/aminoacylase/carboxypeptidase family protein